MERLDLLLCTAFAPVFCLTFLMVLDFCTALNVERRRRALERYQPGLFSAPGAARLADEVLSGRRHAQF